MVENQAPKPASKKRALIVGIASLVVLGLAAILFLNPYVKTAQTKATLEISMSGWKPAVVNAVAGEPITVTMINLDNQFHTDGGGWHNFVVPALDVNVEVGPKKTRSFTFTPTEPGVYDFYCDICCGGKDNPFMQGKLIVS